ncbi:MULTISPECIES: hypothetical protein [Halorubrum]|uniref:Uncharacterized protein n=1 Tax=Halorubrum ruber TaxID=2982524 RepID=A0A8T8LNL6_9EURY|nr:MULTISPECIES: hypothetical protein [Halorubrum]QUO48415.1 hypothetical protein J7656_03400 [Halorubrum ruber]
MRFSRDRRGQSVVVGTVILFGFLILALSLYQVQIVPQENAEVEFQHFEEVRNDLVDLRAGILRAGTTDRVQYETVRLGTDYPPRLFAINPPAPSGTIQTRGPYNISIHSESGDTVNITTRFIQYQPRYNEIDHPPTWYDASVLYLDANEEGGRVVIIEDQNLVNDDGEVRITALQNEFRRSGTQQTTLELRPSRNSTDRIPEGELTIKIPTRLSGEEYWDNADIPDKVYGGVSDAGGNGVHNLTLNTTHEELVVDTVGIQEKPTDSIAKNGSSDDENNQAVENRIFDIEWYDRNSVPIGDVQLNGSISANDEPLDNAIIDFSTTNPAVASFNQENTTTTSVDGNFTANITAKQEGNVTLFAASGDDVDNISVEVIAPVNPSPPIFGSLTASGSQRSVSFDWNIDGQFDSVTFETDSGSATSTDRSGTVSIGKSPGNRDITAIVEGPGGSETCTATIGNDGELIKPDFTCTTS